MFWQVSEEIDEQEFSDLTQDELDMILAEEEVELIDSETNEISLVSGTIGIAETVARSSSNRWRPSSSSSSKPRA